MHLTDCIVMDMDSRLASDMLCQVLPSADAVATSRSRLLESLPEDGIGAADVEEHIRHDIVPALTRSSQSPNYYGFVIGGATPAAASADHMVTETDQNVCVHLPKETIATDVEDRALSMVCELLQLPPDEWLHRTFTTGATASNVLGLACSRDFVVDKAARSSRQNANVAEHGILQATKAAGLEGIQVLTTVPHSSLRKAASIVGLGRGSVVEVGLPSAHHCIDMQTLETRLSTSAIASIVVISCAEVNTGFFATSLKDMQEIRRLCSKFGAWMHVDAAFGLLARVLPETEEYRAVSSGVAGLELADSITGDAHKLLNVVSDLLLYLCTYIVSG